MPGLLIVNESDSGRDSSRAAESPTPPNSSAGTDSPQNTSPNNGGQSRPPHRGVHIGDLTAIYTELYVKLQAAEARLLESIISVIQVKLSTAQKGGERSADWDSSGESAEDVERELKVVQAMLAERNSRKQ